MKKKKLFTLLMAVMLLVASLGLSVHADVVKYTFNGSCKKFFTTKNALESSDQYWPYWIKVNSDELYFSSSTTYTYGYVKLMGADGKEYGDAEQIAADDQVLLDIPRSYEYSTLKVRFINPYYYDNQKAASFSMTINGDVENPEPAC